VQGNELVIDNLICKVLFDFVDSNELNHVGVKERNNSHISQLVEVANSLFISAVEQLSLASEVNVFKQEGLWLGFEVLYYIFEVVVIEAEVVTLAEICSLANSIVDRVCKE
jgi:hypothetical protein